MSRVPALLCSWTILFVLAMSSSASIAQSTQEWIEDSKGCKVWNPQPRPNEAITWSGPCNDGYAHGEGTLQWFIEGKPNGTFTGRFENGKQNGRGTSQSGAGTNYDGEYLNGRMHGSGVLTTDKGLRYEGNFVEGKFGGSGVLTTPDGVRRRGTWVAGSFTYGTMTWPNGDTYTGEFSQNKRTGRGTYTWANGGRYDGEFLEGQFHGRGVLTRPS